MYYLKFALLKLALLLVLFPGTDYTAAQSNFVPADSVSYLWPTNASRQLSSTFAETRSAHLHAGIDIRTWGREGYRVFASRDGIIHRIGMSPFGYGNVIYMKHADDSYTVYAHLNRFEPALQAFADSIRFIDYDADLDLIIEDQKFYYKQGDVIGYSGSTGVGPPHLHFEMRTPEFKPFNPLLTNLRVIDTIPPVFRQLGIEFLNPETLHQNGFEIYNVQRSGQNYDFGEIEVDQPIGISVNVHDRANDTNNIYAVYSLAMVHESDTLFYSVADHFSYRNARHMFLDRSYPILAQTRRGFQRLYRVNGNELPIYRKKINRGVIDFNQGTYPLRIIATDINGNRSVATITLNVKGEKRHHQISSVPTYPVLPQKESTEVSIFLSTSNITGQNFQSGPGPAVYTEQSFYRIQNLFPFKSGQIVQKKLAPDTVSFLSTPDKNFWIQFPKHALYDTLEVRLSIERNGDEIEFNFEPDRLPINRPIYFNFILPEDFRQNERLALFSNDKFRNRLFFIPSQRSGRYLRATLNEISSLILKEDSDAPWVGRVRIDRNLAGNSIVIVPARDQLTGIDYQRSTITVNGQRGIVEYDPEKNLLIYYNPDFTPLSQNKVKIDVYDGAGNRTTREVTLSN